MAAVLEVDPNPQKPEGCSFVVNPNPHEDVQEVKAVKEVEEEDMWVGGGLRERRGVRTVSGQARNSPIF